MQNKNAHAYRRRGTYIAKRVPTDRDTTIPVSACGDPSFVTELPFSVVHIDMTYSDPVADKTHIPFADHMKGLVGVRMSESCVGQIRRAFFQQFPISPPLRSRKRCTIQKIRRISHLHSDAYCIMALALGACLFAVHWAGALVPHLKY